MKARAVTDPKPAAPIPVPTAPPLQLDHKSPVPLHAQVEILLRQLIDQPNYQDGALLPDEVTLATQLGISRGTVRAGISKLVFEGLLERKAGVGTRVATRQFESGISAWRSFSQEMAKKGITVQIFWQKMIDCEATEPVARGLKVRPGTRVKRLDRLRGWDDVPIVYSQSWFHPRLGLSGKEDFTKPLYGVIQAASGAVADHTSEEFQAVVADSAIAKQMQVSKGLPLLLRRHVIFDAGNRPFEYAEIHYRSDNFTLTLDLRREQ